MYFVFPTRRRNVFFLFIAYSAYSGENKSPVFEIRSTGAYSTFSLRTKRHYFAVRFVDYYCRRPTFQSTVTAENRCRSGRLEFACGTPYLIGNYNTRRNYACRTITRRRDTRYEPSSGFHIILRHWQGRRQSYSFRTVPLPVARPTRRGSFYTDALAYHDRFR